MPVSMSSAPRSLTTTLALLITVFIAAGCVGSAPNASIPTPSPAASALEPSINQAPQFLRQARLGPLAQGTEQKAWGTVEHLRLPSEDRLRLAPDFRHNTEAQLEVLLIPGRTLTDGATDEAYHLAHLLSPSGPQEYVLPSGFAFAGVVLYDPSSGSALAFASLPEVPACTDVPTEDELINMDPKKVDEACLTLDTFADLGVTGNTTILDSDSYRLMVDGEVERPLRLSLDDLAALPQYSEVNLLICPRFFTDVAEWSGVPITTVLQEAGMKPTVRRVRVRAADGYARDLYPAELDTKTIFLATRVNGEPLPPEHGFPIQMVIRGEYGSRWVKWVVSITAMP